MSDTIILGGGIAGLGAYYKATQLNKDAVIYEKNSELGGLLANFSINGFRFDNAVHFSFTEIPVVRKIFDKTEVNCHKPNAYCFDRGYWLKHPIQNNLFPLPTEEKLRLIKGFINRSENKPNNYSEWLEHQYGKEISEAYPKKYTQKYWCLNASQLSTTWIGNRMRRAEIDEILRGSLEKRDDNHYYAKEMRYPKSGGYFEFIRQLADSSNHKLNKKAILIDPTVKEVRFSDGEVTSYNTLISSLPLPVVCKLIKDCPQEVLNAANSLLWTSVDLISIGFNKKDIPPYLWYYIYDEDNVAARAYSPSLKSSDNVPEGKSSLQFEVYNLSTSEPLDPDVLKRNIVEKLLENEICTADDILFVHHKNIEFGNVIFDIGMESRRQIVLDYLDTLDIKTCGRFGEWEYFWSDQSFLSGFNALND